MGWCGAGRRPRGAARGARRPWWRTCGPAAGPARAPAGRSSTATAATRRDHVRPAITAGQRPRPDFWHPTGQPRLLISDERGWGEDMESTDEPAELVERVAALDIGKATLMACVRVPHEDRPGARRQEVRDLRDADAGAAGTAGLADLPAGQPGGDGGHLDYWKPPFYLLEDDIRVLGGQRPRRQERARAGPRPTRSTRSGWPSSPSAACAPAEPRATPSDPPAAGPDPLPARLIQERTREKQRVEKLLEDAQIKLSA